MTVIDDNVLHYYKLCTEEQVSTSKMLQFRMEAKIIIQVPSFKN